MTAKMGESYTAPGGENGGMVNFREGTSLGSRENREKKWCMRKKKLCARPPKRVSDAKIAGLI